MHKSATQPLCRYCGRAIAKHTETTWFSWSDPNAPKSKDECQRLSNKPIVSLRYSNQTKNGVLTGERYVRAYSTWDGESYVDQFFCNGEHAKLFGYEAAKWKDGNISISMPAYHAAIARQRKKEEK